jgi:hypothetical protein
MWHGRISAIERHRQADGRRTQVPARLITAFVCALSTGSVMAGAQPAVAGADFAAGNYGGLAGSIGVKIEAGGAPGPTKAIVILICFQEIGRDKLTDWTWESAVLKPKSAAFTYRRDAHVVTNEVSAGGESEPTSTTAPVSFTASFAGRRFTGTAQLGPCRRAHFTAKYAGPF